MLPSAYDLKEYYATPQGQGVLNLLLKRFGAWWPDASLTGDVMIGAGYTLPYLERCSGPRAMYALLPGEMGALVWPSSGRQRCMLSAPDAWPLPPSSVDHIVMVHALEYAVEAGDIMEEAWRTLKPEGRLIIVVPNRTGLWARAEKTPFGHGRPFTQMQLHDLLRDHNFSLERMTGALVAPPFRKATFIQKIAPVLEALAPMCSPLCGVIVAEASKRLYSPIRGKTQKVSKPVLVWGEPAPAGPLRNA